MEGWQVTFIWIGSLIVIGLIFWLVYILFSAKEKVKDRDFCFSFMSNRHNLRSYGDIIDIIPGPSGRYTIVMQPQDLSSETRLKGEKIEPVKIIVDKDHDIILPKGKHSKDKNIHIPMPKHASELSKELLELPFGKFMAFYIEYINSKNAAIDSLKKGLEWNKEHLEEMGWGEVSVARMNHLRELFDEALEAAMSTKKDKVTSFTGYNPPTGG